MAAEGDGAHGWTNPATAKQYAEFCRNHSMYWETSRDLVRLAGIGGNDRVVDLCCGTGVTAECVLETLGDDGRVIALDGSPAMLAEARAAMEDGRVEWVEARAEDLAAHVADADAVVCNSAIWQTDMSRTFKAVHDALSPGGRFVCNIGRQFMIMPFTDDELNPKGPGLFDLMHAYAVIDHNFAGAGGRRGGGPPLRVEGVVSQLDEAGFVDVATDECSYEDAVERQRDWLAIPIFTERLLPGLSYTTRMDCLRKAYDKVDKTEVAQSRWMTFAATRQ